MVSLPLSHASLIPHCRRIEQNLTNEFPLQCLARALLGLALLCESVPEEIVGRQLGFAMAGTSVGFIIGPPLGGVLYERLGWRAPTTLGLVMTALDLIGRVWVVERATALEWQAMKQQAKGRAVESARELVAAEANRREAPSSSGSSTDAVARVELTPWGVLKILLGSARGLTIFGLTFVYDQHLLQFNELSLHRNLR